MNHSNHICKKTVRTFLVYLGLALSACTQQSADFVNTSPEEIPVSLNSESISSAEYICNPVSTSLVVRQNNNVGVVNLSVNPCSGNIIVSLTTEDGWNLKNIYLFIGAKELLPLDQSGNPLVENFPAKYDLSTHQSTFSCECSNNGANTGNENPSYTVAIYSIVDKLDKNERLVKSEEAWAEGIRFVKNSNWATYFDYPLMPCGPCPP